MRSTVCSAVPDGASIFWSWWSSITSAVSNHGAASSAKRTMSTAPMAKLAAITALADDASNRVRKSSMSADENPVVPTTACTPLSAHHAMLSRAASTTVKSTATSAPGVGERAGVTGHLQAGVDPTLAQVEPGVHRVDRGDQLELGIVEHRAGTPSPPCVRRRRTHRL